jgi:hypothetical protein
MDPHQAGKPGGRPSKAALACITAGRAVASSSQRTLNFRGNLTLSGAFMGTVNIYIGGASGAGAGAGAAAGGEADGQNEHADAAKGAAACKGGTFSLSSLKKGVRDIGCAEERYDPGEGGS